MKACPRPSGSTSDLGDPSHHATALIAATTKAVRKAYQRMTFGSVALTSGPVTVNSAPRWQLQGWHNGTMYQLRSVEPTNWT